LLPVSDPFRSRFDESLNVAFDFFAPADDALEINERCPPPSDPEAQDCIAALGRNAVEELLRIGVFGEDNPNKRARHHFHDPVRTHGPAAGGSSPPNGNRGLDNLTIAGGIVESGVEFFTERLRGGGPFGLIGRSALDRALDRSLTGGSLSPSEEDPTNFFALPDAERYLYRSLTAPQGDEREHYLALHFLAMGSVLHLLEDMSSPGHVRNDFLREHIGLAGDLTLGAAASIGRAQLWSLETRGKRDEAIDLIAALATGSLSISRPRQFLAAFDAANGTSLASSHSSTIPSPDLRGRATAAFWDDLAASGDGLAEIVNARFFSEGTIDPPPEEEAVLQYSSPAIVPECAAGGSAGSGAAEVWTAELPARSLLGDATGEAHEFLSSALVPHLARCRFHPAIADVREVFIPGVAPPVFVAVDTVMEFDRFTVIDESVQRDYFEILFPLAVRYVAGFLDHFYERRIDVVPLGDGRSFELINRSRLALGFDRDELRAWYDDVQGGRSWVPLACGAAQVEDLDPGDSLVCQLPAALPQGTAAPRSAGDFAVVIRGTLGGRGSLVTPVDDWREADFVTAVRQVFGWQIAYGGATKEDPDGDGVAGTDAESQENVSVIGFDLEGALRGEPRAVEVDLTAGLRAELPEAIRSRVDFMAPSAEPGGTRIAMSSDVVLERGEAGLEPRMDAPGLPIVSELRVLDIRDRGAFLAESGTTRILAPDDPNGRLQLPVCDFDCPPAWNEDGAEDALYYSSAPVTSLLLEDHFVRVAAEASGRAGEVRGWGERKLHIVSVHGTRAVGFVGGGGLPGEPPRAPALYLADVATGEATALIDLDETGFALVPCEPASPSPSFCDPSPAKERLFGADPRFSSDGTMLVMAVFSNPVVDAGTRLNNRHNGDLWVVDLSSGGFRRLDLGPLDGFAAFPAWSPDGNWIAFQRAETTPSGVADGHLYAVPADGSMPPVQVSSERATRSELSWLPSLLLPMP